MTYQMLMTKTKTKTTGDNRKSRRRNREDRKKKKQQKIDDELAAAEEKKQQKKDQKKADKLKLKYRDRATRRERREGKSNVDYYDSQDTKHVDEEMSKYLGGDQEHTVRIYLKVLITHCLKR